MILFEETFSDPAKLARDWVIAPGMAIRNGVLGFAPGLDEGFCVGTTRRVDFRDFSLTADVRIVRAAICLVLRAVSPTQYYMVQFDLANNPDVVWFHTFTPDVEEGLPPGAGPEPRCASNRGMASDASGCSRRGLRRLSW